VDWPKVPQRWIEDRKRKVETLKRKREGLSFSLRASGQRGKQRQVATRRRQDEAETGAQDHRTKKGYGGV